MEVKNYNRATAIALEKNKELVASNITKKEYHIGSIKVMIKPILKSQNTNEDLLKWAFDTLLNHKKESKRLRQIKLSIQKNLANNRLKRFFKIWEKSVQSSKVVVAKKKEENEVSTELKIGLFVNALTEKQKRLEKFQKNITDVEKIKSKSKCLEIPTKVKIQGNNVIHIVEPPSQNRLKAQKKIIEEMRMRLNEQNRIIEEMKLKQIEEESKKSGPNIINVAKETLNNCNLHRRRALMQLIREENGRNLSRLQSPSSYLQGMEAAKKVDEQRTNQEKARKEAEKLRKDLEVEAKRVRQEQEKIKTLRAERIKKNNELADGFYKKYLFRRYIKDLVHKLIKISDRHLKEATSHYKKSLLKKYFLSWELETKNQLLIKQDLCSSIYKRNILHRFLNEWKNSTNCEIKAQQVAHEFYNIKCREKYFKNLRRNFIENQIINVENKKIAESHFREKLRKKCFERWQKYLRISEEFKKIDERKEYWREIVQRIIPDYFPKGINDD